VAIAYIQSFIIFARDKKTHPFFETCTMNPKISNLIQRTISGTLFVALVITSICINHYLFLAIFSIFCCICIFEFQKTTNLHNNIAVNIPVAVLGALILFVSSFLHVRQLFDITIYAVYTLYVITVFTMELFRKQLNPVGNWAHFILGQVVVSLPFALLNYLFLLTSFNPVIPLSLFVIVWVNDTFAYLSGIAWGKHKLFKRISPKKSWEGLIGGALSALAAGYGFSVIVPELTLAEWLIFSQIIIIFGTFGDLNESLLKRAVGVKDTGTILPGHGGLLDRFDSMLPVIPAATVYLLLIL
jgi:phosphatidate cytidylyltransferase